MKAVGLRLDRRNSQKEKIRGTCAMLTRLSQGAFKDPESVTRLDKQMEDRTKKDCPGMKWLANYALLGPCDYLDIFEAADTDTATKVAL